MHPTYYILEENRCLYLATKGQVKRDKANLFVEKEDYDKMVKHLNKQIDAYKEAVKIMSEEASEQRRKQAQERFWKSCSGIPFCE